MKFRVRATPKFEKRFIKVLDKETQKTVAADIRTLTDDPFGVTRIANIKKLRGSGSLYRLRVGDYRVFYEIDKDKNEVILLSVEHRQSAYR